MRHVKLGPLFVGVIIGALAVLAFRLGDGVMSLALIVAAFCIVLDALGV
jgi:hypothetical protein